MTVIEKLRSALPKPLLTRTVKLKFPTWVGVQLSKPVLLSIVMPLGFCVRAKVRGELPVAAIVSAYGSPRRAGFTVVDWICGGVLLVSAGVVALASLL